MYLQLLFILWFRIIAKINQDILKRNGTLIITADHGNAEEIINLKKW
jgi:bisphosphoglycerate-independent phosphoglycerate mutase (AlkP superfamily)